MKKLLLLFKDKRIDTETRWGGIFAVIAIVAIVVEVVLSRFTLDGIVAGVKDVSGTLVEVAVFWIAVKALLPKKKDQSFDSVFTAEMERLSERYFPLIEKRDEAEHLYYLASHLKAIVNNTPGEYHKFFQLTKSCKTIELALTKTVFVGRGGSDELYAQMKEKIVLSISQKLTRYEIVKNCEVGTSSLKITFKEKLETAEHAKMLVDIIDTVMLTFVVENSRP